MNIFKKKQEQAPPPARKTQKTRRKASCSDCSREYCMECKMLWHTGECCEVDEKALQDQVTITLPPSLPLSQVTYTISFSRNSLFQLTRPSLLSGLAHDPNLPPSLLSPGVICCNYCLILKCAITNCFFFFCQNSSFFKLALIYCLCVPLN